MPCKLTLQLDATWLVLSSFQIFFGHSIVFLNSLCKQHIQIQYIALWWASMPQLLMLSVDIFAISQAPPLGQWAEHTA